MAYDPMGNYTGYDDTQDQETEEERRRRLAAQQANAVVHSTQIKTYGDGTQEETTKRTITAPGPVAPDQVFQRQIQAESGGQHYGPNGQILTSPAGAQGIAQVMPATAARPGYGIKPATPEEIATPEGNRAFGERYKAGMLNLFSGDQQKATAAYNAGPARVQQAEAQAAQQGGSWTDYIPKETVGYLGKVFGNMIPSAQAGELPPQPAQRPLPPGVVRDADGTLRMTQMPQQQPAAQPEATSPYALTAPLGQGLQVPGVPATAQPEASPYIKAYQDVQDDIMGLLPIAKDANAPEWVRRRASERAAEINQQDLQRQRAEQQVKEMSPVQIGSELRKKSEEGSWVKAILFGILGMENSQKEEAYKLGIGRWETSTITGPDGESINVEVKRAPNGKILEGTRLDGTPLTAAELGEMTVGGKATKPVVSTQDVEKGDMKGRVVTETLANGRTKTYVESGGKRFAYDSSWKPVSISTAAEKAVQGKQINMAWDPLIEAAKRGAGFLGEFNAKHGTNFSVVGTSPNGQPIIVDGSTNQIVKPNASGTVTTTAGGLTPAKIEAGEKVGALQSAGVVKHIDEKLVPGAENGNIGSDNIKKQLAIFKDPAKSDALFGLYNAAQSNAGDKRWAIVRDIIGGRLDAKDTEVSKAIAELGLNPDQASALREYNALNGPLVAATVHAIGGVQISDRDRAAAEKMQVDIGNTPALGAFNIKSSQLFGFDLARYKSDWASKQPVTSVAELEREWRKEQARLVEQYGKVADDRMKFIKDNSRGQPATIGLVREAYNRFPTPEYDPNAKGGEGGWKKLRSLNSILGVGQ